MTDETDFTLPLEGQQLKFVPNMGVPYDPTDPYLTSSRYAKDTDDLGDANVISSQVVGSRRHKVVLDIDLPVKVVPSSTEGHYHLFIDKEISWRQYMKIMSALSRAGIVEDGFRRASQARGWTAVRLPWVKKDVDKSK